MQVGVASLVMVFCVLCLTILAVLSVISAHNELALAEKSAAAVTAYYQADSQGVAIYNEILSTYDGAFALPQDCQGSLWQEGAQTYIRYTVAIDTYQELLVELCGEHGQLEVLVWQVQDNGTWEADQSLGVWGG